MVSLHIVLYKFCCTHKLIIYNLFYTKNYRSIALISKVYDALLINHIKAETEKILLEKIRIAKSLKYVKKSLKATLLFLDFSKAFDGANTTSMWSS